MTSAPLYDLHLQRDLEPDLAEWLEVPDGTRLRTACFAPGPGTAPRGTVLLLHGFTEHIEKYYEVIERLRQRGLGVVTFDWRGQGLSSRSERIPMRGHVESFDHLLTDALQVHEALVAPRVRPHLLLAHSMGGHLAIRLLQERPLLFQQAVLSAPMLGFDLKIPEALARWIARAMIGLGRGEAFIPGAAPPDLVNQPEHLTSDPHRLARNRDLWRRHANLALGGPTWRWLHSALNSLRLVRHPERRCRIRTPTLLFVAGRDSVVSPREQARFAAGCDALELVRIEQALHEIMQENDSIQHAFWTRFDQFLAPSVPAG